MIGISIADAGFELLCNSERIGRRRPLDEVTVKTLDGFSSRYAALLDRDDDTSEALLTLGRDLHRFLDGDGRDLATLIDRAKRPVHFEIATSSKRPLDAERAVLRAPWELLASRGDLDEALRIRQDEELPVYERLGDLHSRAVTMGQITDILIGRGDLDKALKVLRHKLLSTFERLGDLRLRAAAMGRIADILESRSDLDQAFRIRQLEQLSIFQRFDDADNVAHTLWKLARIDLAQGRFDDARSRIDEA
jgi:hypothetical protein